MKPTTTRVLLLFLMLSSTFGLTARAQVPPLAATPNQTGNELSWFTRNRIFTDGSVLFTGNTIIGEGRASVNAEISLQTRLTEVGGTTRCTPQTPVCILWLPVEIRVRERLDANQTFTARNIHAALTRVTLSSAGMTAQLLSYAFTNYGMNMGYSHHAEITQVSFNRVIKNSSGNLQLILRGLARVSVGQFYSNRPVINQMQTQGGYMDTPNGAVSYGTGLQTAVGVRIAKQVLIELFGGFNAELMPEATVHNAGVNGSTHADMTLTQPYIGGSVRWEARDWLNVLVNAQQDYFTLHVNEGSRSGNEFVPGLTAGGSLELRW